MNKLPIVHKKLSLHSRIFLMCSLLLVAALIVSCVFISIPTLRIIRENYIQTSQRDMTLVSNITASTISHIFDFTISISSDSRVIDAMKSYPTSMDNEPKKALLRSKLNQDIITIIGRNSDIYMYDIFTLDGKSIFLGTNALSRVVSRMDHSFFKKAQSTLGCQFHGLYSMTLYSGDVPVFLISKVIVNLETREPYGILVLAVRENRFSNTFGNDVPYYITDGDGTIISCADKSLLSTGIQETFALSDVDLAALRADSHIIAEYDGAETLFMLSGPVNDRVGWHVLMATSMHRTQEVWHQTYRTIVVIALAACLVLLLLSFKLSRSITQPIRRLVKSIREATVQTTMRPVADPGGGYEFEVLYKSYNELISHINLLIEQINQEQEEKSNYKFQLIQAQIQPHFLYNTLMTIKSLIDLDMNEMAGDCVYAMSSFYRLSLNKGNDILRIEDEIELSAQYMYIQKLRYIDRLDYIFDIPRSLNDCLIPKMAIQPILENAIYHGVKQKAGKGVIEVKGMDLGDRMVFTISDNGSGMSSQDLERLRASMKSNAGDIHPRNASFGLYSVNRRIQLLYGEAYGVQIDSRQGEYTIVTLTLPKITSIEAEKGGEA